MSSGMFRIFSLKNPAVILPGMTDGEREVHLSNLKFKDPCFHHGRNAVQLWSLQVIFLEFCLTP